jgi:hypothetical protein
MGLTLGSTAITATGTEINKLAGVTAGTTSASKALVAGTAKDVTELYIGSLTYKMPIYSVDADTTLGATQSGTLFDCRTLGAKRTITLPPAAPGLNFKFFVTDADSLRITGGSLDSLEVAAGTVFKTTTSVSGTVEVIALDATKWLMFSLLGTWTSY